MAIKAAQSAEMTLKINGPFFMIWCVLSLESMNTNSGNSHPKPVNPKIKSHDIKAPPFKLFLPKTKGMPNQIS
jgi:hypothetical protein